MPPIRTILTATDFSEISQQALRLAAALARTQGARLVVLHAVEPPVLYGEMGLTVPPIEIFQQLVQERSKALQELDLGVEADRQVVEGLPADEILKAVERSGSDLIVLGSHGRSGFGRVLMGSVAEKVLRHAHCPVLVVKPPQSKPAAATQAEPPGLVFQTILVATDFSKPARSAFRVAEALAGPGTRLIVLYIVEEVHIVTEGYEEALLERLRSSHKARPEVQIDHQLREGPAADEILRAAEEAGCDLIVVGTHGRTGLDRVLMGSVAEKVQRKAHCPVLMVRMPSSHE